MARSWVVNASPLILLGKIHHLHLPEQLSGEMVIPTAVAAELGSGDQADTARQWVQAEGSKYVRRVDLADPIISAWDLGAGETEGLTWARQHPGFEALVDDRAARNCATALQIPIRGTLGIVLLAKREGLISHAKPLLDALVKSGMRIEPAILETVQRLAGE